jgi:hypothetical protein
MSDHTDSPAADANPRLDIGDLFVFAGERGLVLAISVNPLTDTADTGAMRLDPDGLYEFKIDTDGDHLADVTYKVVVAGDGAVQQMTLLRATGDAAVPSDRGGEVLLTCPTSTGADVAVGEGPDGIRLYAGPRQDPFFFNFVGVDTPLANTFRAALNGDGLRNEGSSDNTFRPTNITAIVLEIPMPSAPVAVWAVTSHEGHRIDRCGAPSISAIFLPDLPPHAPFHDLHDAFNLSDPIDDRERFLAVFERTLAVYESPIELATQFLPDVLGFDPAQPTEYPNGRGLVEDPVYRQIKRINADADPPVGPDVNPIVFPDSFPYMTPPVGQRPGWTPPLDESAAVPGAPAQPAQELVGSA